MSENKYYITEATVDNINVITWNPEPEQEITESKEPVPERQEPTQEKTTRRRRGMGSELTLDD